MTARASWLSLNHSDRKCLPDNLSRVRGVARHPRTPGTSSKQIAAAGQFCERIAAEVIAMTDSDLVAIRTYINDFDAEIAQTALEAAGIESMIQSDDCGGMRPHLWMGGIELLVRSEDASKADEILKTTALAEPNEKSNG
jgi:hypothetical protein